MSRPRPEPREPDPLVTRLHYARVSKRLGQAALAARMEFNQVGLSETERGMRDPKLSVLRRWANALGYDIQLVRLPEEEP